MASLPHHNPDMKKTAVIFLSAISLAIILIVFLPLLTKEAGKDTVIRIPANATEENVKDSLIRHLGDNYAALVMRASCILNEDFTRRHGAYLIEKGTSPLRAARKLAKGAQHPLIITINGFRSLSALADKVARRLDFTPDSFQNAATSTVMLKNYDLDRQQALSLFIDDSYEVYWSCSPEEIIKKIGDNYNKVWNGQRREKAASFGLTPAEIMIICSIVDEETNKLDEKGKVGRLYINRLKKGMPLQADPTVRFALNDFSIRRVKGIHLQTDSPYNTYRNRGLPPGPIRTTSIATIDAVLDSEPSDYLYMCAKEDFSGHHNFASTYTEHMENARCYQKELNRRGIR